jgi:hypothetical protein
MGVFSESAARQQRKVADVDGSEQAAVLRCPPLILRRRRCSAVHDRPVIR